MCSSVCAANSPEAAVFGPSLGPSGELMRVGPIQCPALLVLHAVASFILRLFCIFLYLMGTEKGRGELTFIEHSVSARLSNYSI